MRRIVRIGGPPSVSTGTAPTIVFSQSQYVYIHSVLMTLVTSAAVATRQFGMLLADQENITFFGANAPVTQAASLTGYYCASDQFSGGQPGSITGGTFTSVPLPKMWIPPGCRLQAFVNSQDVADTVTVNGYAVEFADDPWDEARRELAIEAAYTALAA